MCTPDVRLAVSIVGVPFSVLALFALSAPSTFSVQSSELSALSVAVKLKFTLPAVNALFAGEFSIMLGSISTCTILVSDVVLPPESVQLMFQLCIPASVVEESIVAVLLDVVAFVATVTPSIFAEQLNVESAVLSAVKSKSGVGSSVIVLFIGEFSVMELIVA